MGKRIIFFSDGTGNAAAKVWRTNVWRTFEGIDLSGSSQIAFYDDGVGTSSFKPLAILGGAFGYGLKRNVLDIYKFLCRNYKSKADYQKDGVESDSDEIFAFGFSRGAFTIRVVVGLVADQGLVVYATEGELETKAKAAYREYRSQHFKTRFGIERPFRWFRNLFVLGKHDKDQRPVEKLDFLGLWDTVAAYGLPIDEMARGVSRYLFPLELPDRRLNKKVVRACHALSLDDERTTFHPVLWDETNELPPSGDGWDTSAERITQVWFAGVHSNVGGGYPDDSLAYVPLTWMMSEAEAHGLQFKQRPGQEPDAFLRSQSAQDKDGRLYDSRSGLGGYYRYGPRDVELLSNSISDDPRERVKVLRPKIHCSVLERVKLNAHLYAPIGVPRSYSVVSYGRSVGPSADYETAILAQQRREDQEKIWNTVWRRRVIYFLSVCASVYLVAYPLFWIVRPYLEASTYFRFITDLIDLLWAFLPTVAGRWLRAYSSDPVWFLEWACIVGIFLWLGSRLKSCITDQMRSVWNFSLSGKPRARIISLCEGSRAWLTTWLLILVVSIYLLVYPDAKHFEFSEGARSWISSLIGLPIPPLKDLLANYMSRGISLLFLLASLAFVIPDRAIQSIRLTNAYQSILWSLKIKWAPALFALGFLYLGLAFIDHLIFNVRDGVGAFCKSSPAREQLSGEALENKQQKYFDIGVNRAWDPKTGTIAGVDSLCFATGWKLERGRKYLFSISTQPNLDENSQDAKKLGQVPRWMFWDHLSSTGGVSMSGLRQARPLGDQTINTRFPLWKRLLAWALYPFRRSVDRPWASVIVRFGSEGNEESFIDPDPARAPFEMQSEMLVPHRDGELFVYINKPIMGIWGLEFWPSRLISSAGIAKITIQQK
jgi:uncharacterized protein (DUF2235 family)